MKKNKMLNHFPKIPALVPRRGTVFSRKFYQTLYHAQGWKFEGEFPNLPKAMAILTPHTSNYDGYIAFLAMLGLGVKVTILGKHTLFNTPLKPLLEWIGVIPVERESPHGLTKQIIDVINSTDKIWVALAPEGTRKKAADFRSGFYHIALGANIPIAMFAFDYDHKVIKCLGVFHPTGDYPSDLQKILSHYQGNFSPKFVERLAHPLQDLLDKQKLLGKQGSVDK